LQRVPAMSFHEGSGVFATWAHGEQIPFHLGVAMKCDLISVVEAAYDLQLGTREWLAQLLERAAPGLDRGLGLIGWTVDLQSATVDEGNFVTYNTEERVRAAILGMVRGWREGLRQSHAAAQPFGTGTQALGLTEAQARVLQPYVENLHPVGVHDALGLTAIDPEGRAILIAAAQPDVTRPNKAAVATWSRIACHISAGARLRHTLAKNAAVAPDAVISPAGAVQHADGPAKSRTAQDEIRLAARAVDRARTRLRARQDEALDLWRGLVSGTWSLVDRFDSDGRRYFVAHRNDPMIKDPRGLSLRERQVLSYAALGHPMKLVAYTLGLTTSTVTEHKKNAMRKLGLRSQADVVSMFAGPR
jgi:DNA-binding CsgD family transcriptional regulator